MKRRSPLLLIILTIALASNMLGWLLWGWSSSGAQRAGTQSSEAVTPAVYTPAHETAWDAVRDFFNRRPTPVQPIAFTHAAHLAKNISCVACHPGVNKGPVAGLPSTNTCMVCHAMIATDRPEIHKVAAYAARGEDIPWQRVYGFNASAHVKFNHAPHIRAAVECAACHGDLSKQTVAVRAVRHTMGFCLDCHKEKKAPVDCIVCHY